jgi:hypothetical protein
MRRLLADPDLTPSKRAVLRFGLAQVLDACKEFDEAGEHLVHASTLTLSEKPKRGQGYDPVVHKQIVDRLLATFDRVCGFDVDSDRPIVIVGLPRSGTTLVEQILVRNSNVFGAGELPRARDNFLRLAGNGADERHDLDNVARLDVATAQDSRIALPGTAAHARQDLLTAVL